MAHHTTTWKYLQIRRDGAEKPFSAPNGRVEVVVYIENSGEFNPPIDTVRSAHDARLSWIKREDRLTAPAVRLYMQR